MFMVMRMITELEVQTAMLPPTKMSLKADDGQIGMVPVFATREQAEAYARGVKVLEIAVLP